MKFDAGKARLIFSFGISFLLAKVAIYVIPLLIAKFASASTYSALEFAQSMASLACTLVIGPVLDGLSHHHLTRHRDRLAPEARVVMWCSIGVSVALMMAVQIGDGDPRWWITAAVFALVANQNVLTTMARAYGWRHATAWSDGLATLLLGLAVAFAFLLAEHAVELWIGILVLVFSAAMAAVVQLGRVKRHWSDTRARLFGAFDVGWSMTLLGVFAIWQSTSGRILLGAVSPEAIPVYSVAFRLVGIALGVHQLASVALFRRIYVARTREADRLFAIILVGVGGATFVVMLAAPLVIEVVHFNALAPDSRADFLAVLASLGVFFFASSAYNWLQFRLNRLRLSGKPILPMIVISALGAGVILAAPGYFAGHIGMFCWVLAAQSILYLMVAWIVLARRNLPHKRTAVVSIAGTLVLGALGLALQAVG